MNIQGSSFFQNTLNNVIAQGGFKQAAVNILTGNLGNMIAQNQSSFAAATQNTFGMNGNMFQTGMMPSPMGPGANFGMQNHGMQSMAQPWNQMGNMMSGMSPAPMGANPMMMNQLMGMMQQIAQMMNLLAPMMQMMQQMQQMQQAGGAKPGAGAPGAGQPGMAQPAIGQPGMAQPAIGQPNLTGAKFPQTAASDFLNTLPGNRRGLARALNVSGRRDEQRIQQAANMLKTAKPTITAGAGKPGKAKLQLSQADVQAIKNAKTPADAKKVVLKAISKQTGVSIGELNMRNKNGIRSSKGRNAINKLLGTKVRNGREKNSGSSLVLDSIAESVAKSIRGGSFGSTKVQSPGHFKFQMMGGAFSSQTSMMNNMHGGEMGMNSMTNAWAGGSFGQMNIWHVPGQTQEIPNPASEVSVDLSGFVGAANKVGELASPLIFDLEGTGLKVKNGGLIPVDIKGDGNETLITDIDSNVGLLVFDSKSDDEDVAISGRDMFGDNTDLSAYGIEAPTESGNFRDGFQALRALCEHFKLVHDSKQFLSVDDLAFLEEEVGLRMQVGSIVDLDQRRFNELGITEINLGNPAQTQHLADAKEDHWGNKIMMQDGANFTINGEVRMYADIWFKIQARLNDAPAKEEFNNLGSVDFLTRR